MDKLSSNTHEFLTENILKILSQNRISTFLEFLGENVYKLSTLTKLTIPQVIKVRSEALVKFSAPARTGDELYNVIRTKCKKLGTGVSRLDRIISGGIPVGCITEIVGLAGAGKTQFCFAMAINVAMHSESNVLYVDTKGDFSAVTIQKYLEKAATSHSKMAEIMDKIKVVRVWTMNELIDLLHHLKNGRSGLSNVRLIVVDSLPCLMFQKLGDESKIGLTILNKFVNIARLVSKEMNLAIICVNILTRWVEQAAQDIEDQDSVQGFQTKETWVEKKHRCLGRYWQHIPALVLQLEIFNDSKDNKTIIGVTITKFVAGECGVTCSLNINDIGIT